MERWASDALERADEAWPCQRLRIGGSLLLFFLFEVTLGQRLPEVMAYMTLGLGLALVGSALYAIRAWKQKAQIALIVDALDHRPG